MTAATAAVVDGSVVVASIVVGIDADRHTTFSLDGTPWQGCDLIVLPDGSPVSIGWTYVDGEFIAPPPPPDPEPTPDPDQPTDGGNPA